MMLLRSVERTCSRNLCHNRLVEATACSKRLLGRLRQLTLLLCVIKYACAIRCTAVMELSPCIGRINLTPENIQQLLVWEYLRIISDMYRFGMPCRLGADFLIRRID